MRTRKILFMLISAITVLWAVPALSANSITITSTLKAVISNDVPKFSAVNANQTLKKGQPVETVTITVDSGDWIIWSNDLPSGLTVSLTNDTQPPYTGTITGTPSGLRNGTHTYSVAASNDAGRTEQTITLTINGSSVDKEFLTDVDTDSSNYTIFTPPDTLQDTTISPEGHSTTSTKAQFTDSYGRILLSSDIAITSESTDLTGRVGEEFVAVFSVDVSLDLRDEDYTYYNYSLDIEGLPDWLKASGELVSEDSVGKTHHHEFTLSGTPVAYDDTVNVTFTATVNISGDTPVLRAVSSKDVNVSVSFYTISYDLQDGTLTAENQNPVSYDFTTPTFKLNNPAKKGYTFAGWTGTEVTNASTDVTIPKGSKGDREYTANWTLDTYTLSYTLNGGTVSTDNPASYTVNSDDITLKNPEQKGHTFVGWTGTGITEASTDVTIPKGSTGNREYTALWEIATYTLSYTLNGGTVSPANPTSYTINSDDITLKNPEQKGYTFTGWTGTGLSGATNTVTIPANSTGNRTYTANWTLIQYTISLDLGGGEISGGNSISYNYETDTFKLNIPTKKGYDFTGWNPDGEDTISLDVEIPQGSAENLKYVANWKATIYVLSYDLRGGTVSQDNPVSYTIESDDFTLNNPEREGCTFAGWTGTSVDAEMSMDVTIINGSTGNREYQANWELKLYTLSYDLDGGTVSFDNPLAYTIESDDIKLNNPTRTYYTFKGWSFDNALSIDVTIPAGSTEDRKYTAIWEAVPFAITYDLQGGTLTEENPEIYDITSDTFSLNKPSKTGYEFSGWTGTDLTEASTNVTIPQGSTGERSYTATWTPVNYPINYTLNNGNVSGNPATYTIETETFTLNNPSKNGYTFSGWTGTSLDQRTQTVTIAKGSTGNRNYTANFTPITYTITYNLNGGKFAVPNPTGYTIESASITLNNPTRTNYDFEGWTGTGLAGITKTVTIPSNSTGNRTYTAYWTTHHSEFTLELNGGLFDDEDSASYDPERGIYTLNTPTRKGYEFIGWNLEGEDDISMNVEIPKGSEENLKYIANWKIAEYTLSYELNGGTVSPNNPASYTIESEDFTLINPSKEGYVFEGWTGTSVDVASSQDVTIAHGSIGNREYTANFSPIRYTITYNLDGGTATGNPESYTIETETFTLNNPEREDRKFAGWTGTDLTDVTQEVTVTKGSTGDREYTAVYVSANPYLYTKEPNPDDEDSSHPSQPFKSLSDVIGNMNQYQLDGVKILKVDENIEDISGIEAFTNLETLDLTEAYSLEKVDLSGNEQILEVDISGNPAVQSLNISGSSIEKLDASGCDNLTQLDVSGCEDLRTLDVSSTNLTNLNVEGCVNLEELDCSNGKLNELHVSSCVALVRLDCSSNNLYRLDVGRLANLAELKCDNQARQLWNVGQSQAIHFLDFFHDDGVNGTGIENITNVQFKIRKTGEILPGGYSEYYLYDGIVWFSVPLNGGMVISREDYPPEIYYDYDTGFQKAGSSSVSSAASGTLMHVTIENTIEVPTSSTSEVECNAGMTFPMLALVALLLIRKR